MGLINWSGRARHSGCLVLRLNQAFLSKNSIPCHMLDIDASILRSTLHRAEGRVFPPLDPAVVADPDPFAKIRAGQWRPDQRHWIAAQNKVGHEHDPGRTASGY